jgi:hypothetical protein
MPLGRDSVGFGAWLSPSPLSVRCPCERQPRPQEAPAEGAECTQAPGLSQVVWDPGKVLWGAHFLSVLLEVDRMGWNGA